MSAVVAPITPAVAVEPPPLKARERLMDVAEKLFGDIGFEATSTRAIALEAGVTLGTVHYHFASKRKLFIEIFVRRGKPLAQERIRLLQEAHLHWPDGHIPLTELIKRFAFPLFRAALQPGGAAFARLHARLTTEPPDLAQEARGLVHNDVTPLYVAAFRKALPHVPEQTLYWRFYFMLGVNTFALLDSVRLHFLSGGVCSSNDLEQAMEELVPFLEAGFRAPAR
ncbi:MAG: TetR/AcrR family transcriptional regulator [Caldimonas sp.]